VEANVTEPALAAPSTSTISSLDLEAWKSWLRDAVDPAWRPGEWSQPAWFFDGDLNHPRTGVIKCATTSCWTLVKSRNQLCRHCVDAWPSSGLQREVFIASYQRPKRIRMRWGQERDRCVIERGTVRCGRAGYSLDLCRTHYMRWSRNFREIPIEDWIAAGDAKPYDSLPTCIVRGCGSQRCVAGLCRSHDQVWRLAKREGRTAAVDAEEWAREAAPFQLANQFSLLPLEETLRWEFLYGLQQRDARGGVIEPTPVRHLVKAMRGIASLTTTAPAAVEAAVKGNNTLAHLREIIRAVRLATLGFRGVSPTDGDVWDLTAVGLTSQSLSGLRQHAGTADFTQIRQPWLRETLKEWARTTSPTNADFQRTFKACVTASDALHVQPGGGLDPGALRAADMKAVYDTVCSLQRKDGKLAARSWRANVFSRFLDMLDFGRQANLLSGMSSSFSRDRSLVVPYNDEDEDEDGKAIPEPVIAQLDAQLGMLGQTFPYGDLDVEDIKLMLTTAYTLLRDTGRRPIEVASLKRNCLKADGQDTLLIWDNHKRRRWNRELLIEAQTAAVIRRWQARRIQIPAPSRSEDYLFPAITDRSGVRHMGTGSLANALREWVASLPSLLADEVTRDGERALFDRSLIYPYAFRHSYAQRHADAGVPIDVLKELMDHRNISTTMTYYKVSLERKRQAIKTLRRHTVDRSGQRKPFTSSTAYQVRSVAVPFGNCTEPSNVKAGGKSCPLRFQCAGCGFYRPDPSYLPAIEDHVNSLRADRETAQAMEADEFVVRNLTDQISAFTDVAGRMTQQLAGLPEEEQREVTAASAVLRKVRAQQHHKLLPLTVVSPEASDAF
jgi:hypothetical protein